MSKIKVMSDLLANKIAAGEVIEKIASVLKELVENSIDAGSTTIKVALKDSGFKAIEIIDNGSGMARDDAQTAFLRHATSKVYKEEDLYFIDTLGFRGEALASIAAVAEVKLKTYNGNESTFVHIKGGKILDVSRCDERKGTDIEVTNLFYNTPARLKYLKSPASELATCSSFIERLALSKPNISFLLTNNDKEVVRTSGSGNLLKTIYEIFGSEISSNMYEFKESNDDFSINGYACKPNIIKSTKNYMITLLNGRIIKNNEINNAINEAYYTYKPEGRYPVVVLNVETDPTIIDVNIHPTKQDVKISKINDLTSLITKAIKNTLYNNLLIVKPLEETKDINDNNNFQIDGEPVKEHDIPIAEEKINEPVDCKQVFMDFGSQATIYNEKIKSLVLYPVGLVHGTYIIAENDDGMYLIDQHAAYERINYERYMKALMEKEINKMPMLIPITIELIASDYNKLIMKEDLIKSLGFEYDLFGINTIVIKSHPTWLKEGYEEESIHKIIDLVLNLETDFDRVKFEEKIAITLACKMSIKANMHISEEEIKYILDNLVLCDNPYNCPHGRPTIIKFTKYDLEKLFKRAANW